MGESMSILAVIGGPMALVGAAAVVYQIYQMTVLDAKARNLKHPKLWGAFAMSGNNSNGLILYLIGRRRFPIVHMTEKDKKEIEARKKAAGVGLIFLAIGCIFLIMYTFV